MRVLYITQPAPLLYRGVWLPPSVFLVFSVFFSGVVEAPIVLGASPPVTLFCSTPATSTGSAEDCSAIGSAESSGPLADARGSVSVADASGSGSLADASGSGLPA